MVVEPIFFFFLASCNFKWPVGFLNICNKLEWWCYKVIPDVSLLKWFSTLDLPYAPPPTGTGEQVGEKDRLSNEEDGEWQIVHVFVQAHYIRQINDNE